MWPSEAIWRQRSESTFAQVMACCLTAPSHYLNQCWFIISTVQWHSYKGSLTRDNSAIDHSNQLENYSSKIYFESPRGQWVNMKIWIFLKKFHEGKIDIDSVSIQCDNGENFHLCIFGGRGKQLSTYITKSNMMRVDEIIVNKTIKQIIILMTIVLYRTTI